MKMFLIPLPPCLFSWFPGFLIKNSSPCLGVSVVIIHFARFDSARIGFSSWTKSRTSLNSR